MNSEEASKTDCVFRFEYLPKSEKFFQKINRLLFEFLFVIGLKMAYRKKMLSQLQKLLKMQELISSMFLPEIPSRIKNLKWEECGKLRFRIWFAIRFTSRPLQQELLPTLTKSTPLF